MESQFLHLCFPPEVGTRVLVGPDRTPISVALSSAWAILSLCPCLSKFHDCRSVFFVLFSSTFSSLSGICLVLGFYDSSISTSQPSLLSFFFFLNFYLLSFLFFLILFPFYFLWLSWSSLNSLLPFCVSVLPLYPPPTLPLFQKSRQAGVTSPWGSSRHLPLISLVRTIRCPPR